MKAGESIGAYVLVRELGRGGMGTVFLAEHSALGRRAAIKVLQPELTSNQQMLTRFFNEAKAASAIKSPGIVEIYDFGRHVDGSAYIVMELLEGEPLGMRLARLGRLPLGNALVIGRQIASALAPAHRAGIVHRDLKPDNVFLVPDEEVAGGERVKLLDFGIAKLLGDGEPGGPGRLTTTKTVMGTPHYMSPEQCRGAGLVDARSDLYALGCILFELISGQPPFQGEGAGDLIGAHIYVAPRRLAELVPGLPAEVDELVLRLLAKNPAQRPQTAEEVASMLSALAARAGTPSQTYAAPTSTRTANPVERAPIPLMDTHVGLGISGELPTRQERAIEEREPQGTPMGGMLRPVDRSTERMSRRNGKVVFGVGVLLLMGAAVYGVLLREGGDGSSDGSGESEITLSRADTDAGPSKPTVEVPNESSTPTPPESGVEYAEQIDLESEPAAPTGESSKNKRTACMQLQREERWAELKRCSYELRSLAEASGDDKANAISFLQQANLELSAKAKLEAFQTAQKSGDVSRMSEIVRVFDGKSMYSSKIKEMWERERERYVASNVEKAKSAAAQGHCSVLPELSQEIALYNARSAELILGLPCPAVNASSRGARRDSCNEPKVKEELDRLYEEVQSVRISDTSTTIQLVENVLSKECISGARRNILARIGVIAACAENRKDKVLSFYSKTKDPSLVNACPEILGDLIE